MACEIDPSGRLAYANSEAGPFWPRPFPTSAHCISGIDGVPWQAGG